MDFLKSSKENSLQKTDDSFKIGYLTFCSLERTQRKQEPYFDTTLHSFVKFHLDDILEGPGMLGGWI